MPRQIFNLPQTINIRRNLRKQPIAAERKIWYWLRKKQLGYRFCRQYVIGKYVADFYCPAKKMVIEIDGATHSLPDEIRKDKEKESYLKSLGLVVKRYNNSDIYHDIGLVVDDIRSFLK